MPGEPAQPRLLAELPVRLAMDLFWHSSNSHCVSLTRLNPLTHVHCGSCSSHKDLREENEGQGHTGSDLNLTARL